MKVLALLRHADAVKDDPGGDHARPLSAAGRGAAERAGQALWPHLPHDTRVVASDARRTRQTAELAFPTFPASQLRKEPALYTAEPEDLLDFLRALPDQLSGAVLVGHNPGLSHLAARLAVVGAAADLSRAHHGLATADAALFHLSTGWADIAPDTSRLVALLLRTEAGD